MYRQQNKNKEKVMKNFCTFQKMVTPSIIVVLYWLGVLGSFVAVYYAVTLCPSAVYYATIPPAPFYSKAGEILRYAIIPVTIFVAINIAWRLICEWLVVIFAIHKELIKRPMSV